MADKLAKIAYFSDFLVAKFFKLAKFIYSKIT